MSCQLALTIRRFPGSEECAAGSSRSIRGAAGHSKTRTRLFVGIYETLLEIVE